MKPPAHGQLSPAPPPADAIPHRIERVGPDAVGVDGEVLRSKRIFINVGARAARPDMPGVERVPHLDNSSFLALDELPTHLIVVGGSYVGLEFGQMYRRFGSEVTILERGPRLVPREDEDASAALRGILEQDGIAVRVEAECTAVEPRGRDIVARVSCAEGCTPAPPTRSSRARCTCIRRCPSTCRACSTRWSRSLPVPRASDG